jgi:hypothetical protein
MTNVTFNVNDIMIRIRAHTHKNARMSVGAMAASREDAPTRTADV